MISVGMWSGQGYVGRLPVHQQKNLVLDSRGGGGGEIANVNLDRWLMRSIPLNDTF